MDRRVKPAMTNVGQGSARFAALREGNPMIVALFAVTLLNVLVAAGFSLAGVMATRNAGGAADSPRVFALYAAARALPLVLIVAAAMLWGSPGTVAWLGLFAGIVQLADAYVGRIQGDAGKTFCPLAIAAAQAVVLALWWWG